MPHIFVQSTDEDTEAVEDLNSALDDVSDFDGSSTASSLSAIGDAASTSTGKVVALGLALKGLGGVNIQQKAEGTSYAKEGPSLVNEES